MERAMSLGSLPSIFQNLGTVLQPIVHTFKEAAKGTSAGLDIFIQKFTPSITMAQIRAIYFGTYWCGDGI